MLIRAFSTMRSQALIAQVTTNTTQSHAHHRKCLTQIATKGIHALDRFERRATFSVIEATSRKACTGVQRVATLQAGRASKSPIAAVRRVLTHRSAQQDGGD